MEKPVLLSLSVLITREEYVAFSLHREQRRRRGQLPLSFVFGVVLCAAGACGVFFGRDISLSVGSAVCLFVVGLFFGGYDSLIAPFFMKAAAAAFDRSSDLGMAGVYRFTSDAVQVENARLTGTIPLAAMTSWTQDEDLIALYFGRELSVWIPRRLLTDEQTDTLLALLQAV